MIETRSLRTSDAARGRELIAALKAIRGAFVGIAIMSGMINILQLTGSFFMLEVYDRVLPSRSMPTLLALGGLVAILFVFQGGLELLRGRILVRIGDHLNEVLSARTFQIILGLPLRKADTIGIQPIRDLDQIGSYMGTGGPSALFDLPWIPLYLGICFLFHPLIGLAALVGSVLLVSMTLLTHVLTRRCEREAANLAILRNNLAEAGRRNAEVVRAMGMAERLAELWSEMNLPVVKGQRRASDVADGIGALTRVARMSLQSLILGLGAYLVINEQSTAGIIIASSILTSRALSPVELAIAHWKGFIAARQSWDRLKDLLRDISSTANPITVALPRPERSLAAESLSIAPPGLPKFIVQDISFRLGAGETLGIIGPNGSGKSSLLRALVGVWEPVRGKVRLDGAALEQWAPEALGRYVGYLPQDVELFAGSIAQNIARFDRDPDPDAVIAAARAAGVHDLVVRLPRGYETPIGESGATLSAGQRQRIALARALYGNPFLVVLDEPNSNLDLEGEQALAEAIKSIRERGGITVIVAQRTSALAAVDQLLFLVEGRTQALGPRDEILKKIMATAARRQPAQVPLTVVSEGHGSMA